MCECGCQEELNRRQAEQIVVAILRELVDGVRSPDRPASPVDAYVTEEELFDARNTGVREHDDDSIRLFSHQFV